MTLAASAGAAPLEIMKVLLTDGGAGRDRPTGRPVQKPRAYSPIHFQYAVYAPQPDVASRRHATVDHSRAAPDNRSGPSLSQSGKPQWETHLAPLRARNIFVEPQRDTPILSLSKYENTSPDMLPTRPSREIPSHKEPT